MTNIDNYNKKVLGQYYTITNPFNVTIFYDWEKLIPKNDNSKNIILEPFAGSNNIVQMIEDLNLNTVYNWICYDIDPNVNNKRPEYKIFVKDTIKDYPKNYSVAITNPPYLAKNSATRQKIEFPKSNYDDLYKIALEVMLNNTEYVAAIIPDSFITSKLFHNRLYAVVSLTYKMFEDTECPVCLALFIPSSIKKEKLGLDENDFYVYNQSTFINKYKDLLNSIGKTNIKINWKFNEKNGEIGIMCVDNKYTDSIKFIPGDNINPEKIKVSSRSVTRVSGLDDSIDLDKFIEICNLELADYRYKTSDVFLTSFKGLREDDKYRKRLDFQTARYIMDKAVENLKIC